MKRLTILAIAVALGTLGCSGEDGARGPQGEPGEPGAAGPPGRDGMDGDDGADGPDGTNGRDGADGEDGRDGADGADGMQGAEGPAGPQGPRGPAGGDGRTDLSDYVLEGGQDRTILARGGTGTDGAGGDGNFVEVINDSSASAISVLSTGTPNAQFTPPDYPPYLGENPKTIDTDTVLALAASPMPDRVVAGSSAILGDDGTNPATGLHVVEGVTLTLVPNFDSDNDDGDDDETTGLLDHVQLEFTDGVLLEGTIVLAEQDGAVQGDGAGAHVASLGLACGQFISRPGSAIDAAGEDHAAGSDGGNGGAIVIETGDEGSGTIILAANVDASGGDGDQGGTGGDVSLSGFFGTVYVTGTIDTSGGTGGDGLGGDAGDPFLNADSDYSGGNFISGDVIARGGDGTDGGGQGGAIYIDTEYNGAVVISDSATIDASGGSATSDGPGGDGGAVEILALSGTIRAAGTITARGGEGAGGGDGGDGGQLTIESDYEDYPQERHSGGYGIYLGANIDTSGGDGAAGGSAGSISIETWGHAYGGYAEYGVEPTMLLGYAGVDVRGGDGTTSGGHGGSTCYLETWSEGNVVDSNGDEIYFAGGSILNEVPWNASGGHGDSGTGGDGGSIEFHTNSDSNLPRPPDLTNTAALTTNGGDGADGGTGGSIDLYAMRTLLNEADLSCHGGEGSNQGGEGGSVALAADYALDSQGEIDAAGGAGGTGNGGMAGSLYMASRWLTHAGDLIARGGSSVDGDGGDAFDESLPGGDLPTIEIRSTELPSDLSGTAYAGGGVSTNGADGAPGRVYIDALRVALDENGEIAL